MCLNLDFTLLQKSLHMIYVTSSLLKNTLIHLFQISTEHIAKIDIWQCHILVICLPVLMVVSIYSFYVCRLRPVMCKDLGIVNTEGRRAPSQKDMRKQNKKNKKNSSFYSSHKCKRNCTLQNEFEYIFHENSKKLQNTSLFLQSLALYSSLFDSHYIL